MNTDLQNAAEDLETAATLIEGVGWVQGRDLLLVHTPGKAEARGYCINGAITQAIASKLKEDPFQDFYQRHATAFGAVIKHLGGSPVQWNDEPGRTAGEVIDALKGAAKDIRNEL
jgi:hypothetical protein